MDLIAKWAKKKNRAPMPLVVIHSHSHGDHTAGDAQFKTLPNVQFVAATPADVQRAAGIKNWPSDIGQIDLGQRVIDVIPIPGHDVASIALYDRRTGNLMTGDSLYPGRLYVPEAEIATYAASAKRLVDFVATRPVAQVLGAHIEQGRRPYFDYPRGTTYQPDEHVLQLTRAHVFELHEARWFRGRRRRHSHPTSRRPTGLACSPASCRRGGRAAGPTASKSQRGR
jgi:glyoxylase-like metal-dependent hydrolase (beta-lactamase superfamily II)